MTAPKQTGWTDAQVEQVVGNLLRFGVLLAAAVILIGGVWYLVESGTEPAPNFQVFGIDPTNLIEGGGAAIAAAGDFQSSKGEPAKFLGPVVIVEAALSGDSLSVVQLGILLLIATPVARVIFSAYAFLRERDFAYMVITLIVLVVLLYSLFSSRLGGL